MFADASEAKNGTKNGNGSIRTIFKNKMKSSSKSQETIIVSERDKLTNMADMSSSTSKIGTPPEGTPPMGTPLSTSRELESGKKKSQAIEMQAISSPLISAIQFDSSSFHHQTTLSLYQSKAHLGDPLAQARVGYCYEYGRGGIPIDYKESYKWYLLSSNQGHAEGQVGLGNLFIKGLGIEKDEKEGLRLIEASAGQGNIRAQGRLGLIYLKGLCGVTKDIGKGIEYYKSAAEKGDIEAQYNLGLCFETGNGVKRDDKDASHWYRLAAEQGYANAQYNLGIYYFNNCNSSNNNIYSKNSNGRTHSPPGTPNNPKRRLVAEMKQNPKLLENQITAVYWYKLAAEQGIKEAQYALGLCYQYGKGGLAINKKEAMRWYQLAEEQGLEKARKQYNLLTGSSGMNSPVLPKRSKN